MEDPRGHLSRSNRSVELGEPSTRLKAESPGGGGETTPLEGPDLNIGEPYKFRSAEISPQSLDAVKLELTKAEHERRGRLATGLLRILCTVIVLGFVTIFAAMYLHMDAAPLREFLSVIIAVLAALLGTAFNFYDPRR